MICSKKDGCKYIKMDDNKRRFKSLSVLDKSNQHLTLKGGQRELLFLKVCNHNDLS